MATPVIRNVNPDSSGGNGTTGELSGVNAAYVSQASFITNEAKDITLGTGTDEKYILNCANAGTGTVDTSRATYASTEWTTDAANDNIIQIIGEIDPLRLDTVNYYSIDANDDYDGSIEIDCDVNVDKVQIQNGNLNDCIGINYEGSTSLTSHITNCIIEGMVGNAISIGNGQPATSNIYIQNNVLANSGNYGLLINDPNLYVTNNTITGNVVGVYGYAYIGGAATAYFANNLAVNNTTDFGHPSWHTGRIIHDFNADSDNTLNSNETNGVQAATVTFVSATDWHIDSTGESELVDAGAGPTNSTFGSYVLAADPDGDARSGLTCDIGADEIGATGIPVGRSIVSTFDVDQSVSNFFSSQVSVSSIINKTDSVQFELLSEVMAGRSSSINIDKNINSSFSAVIEQLSPVNQVQSAEFESLQAVAANNTAIYSVESSLVAVSNSVSSILEILQGVDVDRSAPVSVLQGLSKTADGLLETSSLLVVSGPAALEILQSTDNNYQVNYEALKLIESVSSVSFEYFGVSSLPNYEYFEMHLNDIVQVDAKLTDSVIIYH